MTEIGSASLMNAIGIETNHSFRNSAAYIQYWLQVRKNDVRFIVSASSKAEKAVNYILGIEARASFPENNRRTIRLIRRKHNWNFSAYDLGIDYTAEYFEKKGRLHYCYGLTDDRMQEIEEAFNYDVFQYSVDDLDW